MNSLRNKLIASVTMLAVAAIMLTSASFAWYTVSKTGELEQIKVEMTATDNLEIAVAESAPGEVALGDAGDQTKWGGKAVYAGEATLSQLATMSEGAIKTADYDDGGRLKTDLVLANKVAKNYSYGPTSATAKLLGTTANDENNAAAAEFDCYLRTNSVTPFKIKCSEGTFKGEGMTVVCEADGKSVTWTDGNIGDEISITPTLTDGYYVTHVVITAFVNGDETFAKDVDSETAEMPSFEGSIEAYRPTAE